MNPHPRQAKALLDLVELPDDRRRIGPCVLLRLLGRGGFAPVWLAEEMYGGVELRTAAVKLFALEPSAGEELEAHRDRILQEARSLCRVEHPNVVRFYSLLTDDARGLLGLSMEYVAGASVEVELESGP